MVGHLLRAFLVLFATRRSRAVVATLVFLMAAVPIAEMLVIRLFSTLIVDGPSLLREDFGGTVVRVVIFFLSFGGTRGLHHFVRFYRIRAFGKGFDSGSRKRSPSQESWEWALAFELSGVLSSLIQVLTFGLFFLILDWPTGALNAMVCLGVLSVVSVLYGRQLGLQIDYAEMGSKPGTVGIAERVGGRIRDAEVGSLAASLGLVLVLLLVLVRTLRQDIGSADAIVLFLGLRLLYGQLGALSAGVMRFARASARRGEGFA